MKHLLMYAVLWLCAGMALATEAPRIGERGAPASVPAPAVPAVPTASQQPPARSVEEITDEINAGLRETALYQERHKRMGMRITWGLALAWLVFAWLTLRSSQPRMVRFSRMALWTPCFLLACAWFFPVTLLLATVFAPAIAVAWWKRALPWWELGVGSALFLPTVLIAWAALLAMGGFF